MTGVEESDGWQLKAGRASIHAKNVVLATNIPIAGPVPYDERTRPRSHIAMAFRIDPSAAIDGMFIGIDEPTHSLRTGRDQHGLLLVVLGSKFGTGHEGDVAKISGISKRGPGEISRSATSPGGGSTRTTIPLTAFHLPAHWRKRRASTSPLGSTPGA